MRLFAKATIVGLLLFVSTTFATNGKFPLGPDPVLTPGAVCQSSRVTRYPEKIKYCDRNVGSQLKRQIFRDYDRELGYSTHTLNRMAFKIDHFIPLCAGGSNDRNNLWPQHRTVYEITDPMEPLICDKMAQGRLAQAKAIELIRTGKLNLQKVPEIMHYLESL